MALMSGTDPRWDWPWRVHRGLMVSPINQEDCPLTTPRPPYFMTVNSTAGSVPPQILLTQHRLLPSLTHGHIYLPQLRCSGTFCRSHKLKGGAVGGVASCGAGTDMEDVDGGGFEAGHHHAGAFGACRRVPQMFLPLNNRSRCWWSQQVKIKKKTTILFISINMKNRWWKGRNKHQTLVGGSLNHLQVWVSIKTHSRSWGLKHIYPGKFKYLQGQIKTQNSLKANKQYIFTCFVF